MASRNELAARAGVLGFDHTTVPNDSKLEQKIIWLEKNRTAFTGALATGVLTSTNVQVSNNDTVTIGDQVYTFKTTLTGAAYEVFIGADADTSLLNLARCINQSGAGSGTAYAVSPVNRWVTCSATVTTHTITVTARDYAVTNASVATTKVAVTLSWGATTLASGTVNVVAPNTTSTTAGSAGLSGGANTSV